MSEDKEIQLEKHRREELDKFMAQSMNHITKKVKDIVAEFEHSLYTDFAMHIDTDAWTNYREYLKNELKGGLYRSVNDTEDGWWAKSCRDMIFHEHREELEKALNQDLQNEVKRLKEELNNAYNRRI